MPVQNSRWIVITSIFEPTPAVQRFAGLNGWKLVVAGDRKTPRVWHQKGAIYLSVGDQELQASRIGALLPWNHYCRKMMGYLHAMEQGAAVIADSDDDNLPQPDWDFPDFDLEAEMTDDDLGFVNIYRSFTNQDIWPRGFPLKRIRNEASLLDSYSPRRGQCKVAIWQGLADGDPDVDAIYRLTSNKACIFDERDPVVLGQGTLCPFNSQNTAFRREVFELLYLPAKVTFRFTDILRGLVAQPILWSMGYRLGFSKATVVQERNPHDYLKDFESEVPCYLYPDRVIEIVGSAVSSTYSVGAQLHAAYEALVRAGIVPADEMPILEAWLEDVGSLT